MYISDTNIGEFPIALAPMEDITDASFRIICKAMGADLVYTEFISSEGLIRDVKKSKNKLRFYPSEHPIGIQIFGHNEASMIEAAQIAASQKPDFIDLNFGCPVKKVIRKGAGAALLADVPKMTRIAAGVVKGTSIPVTAKTRLGIDEKTKNIEHVAQALQDVGIKALTIHGRTLQQKYGGKADWTLIGKVKSNPNISIPIIGNGDIISPAIALEAKKKYHVDGIMIGRAAIGNPWIFKEIKYYLTNGKLCRPPNIFERIETCKKHVSMSIDVKGETTTIFEMRKHYTHYFKGYPNFKPMKAELMQAENKKQLFTVLEQIKARYRIPL